MSINYAILGLLSVNPLSGYDIKKMMQDSPFMYWSGNNNQIYKALLELNEQGHVTNQIIHQESSPSKKIYTITEDGLADLRRWLLTTPDAPEWKKPFLVQLAFSDLLTTEELTEKLDTYEQEMQKQVAFGKALRRKDVFTPERSDREVAVWRLIYDNIEDAYAGELNWIQKVRREISSLPEESHHAAAPHQLNRDPQEEKTMTYQVIEKYNNKYILLDDAGKPLQNEQDGIDLISLCAQHDARGLLISGERLSNDFLDLRTGLAGAVLQKFTNYGIRAAVILDEVKVNGRFKEFLAESNAGNMFRTYSHLEDAENWLLS